MLRPYQSETVSRVRVAFSQGSRSVLMVAPTGAGKCLAKGTPVLMFDGGIIPVESVRVGDLLMGPDSKPRRVLSLARGREEMFRITPKKGDAYTVNASHILSLKITNTKDTLTCGGQTFTAGQIANVSVRDYLAANKTFRHCAKGWRTAVDFKARKTPAELPPYILGAWLGDGSSRGPVWFGIDHEVFREIKWHALAMGLHTAERQDAGKCPEIAIVSRETRGRGRHTNPVRNRLQSLGLLRNKHVPEIYKINSRAVRLEVLAGLMDTDGSMSHGGFDFVSKFERLAEDVVFLARSVGLAAYKRECRKECVNNGTWGTYYRVSISGNTDIIPTRIARKRAPKRTQIKNHLLHGIAVESVGEGDYYGFEIDGDRLFMLGDFTVTHNTVMFSYITNSAAAKGRRVMILVHRQELLDQCSRTLTENGVSHGIVASGRSMNQIHSVQVASVQTLVRRLETIVPPDLIICDEAHHSVSGTFKKTLAGFPAARILGVTATPERLDGKGLGSGSGGPFDVMVQGPTAADLIAGGYLSAPVYYAPPSTVDATRLHSVGGDFNRGEAAAEFDKPKITGDAVQHYTRIAPGAPAVAFCITIDHAKHVASEFRAAGYRADTIDGTLSDWERRDRVASLADGRLHVLTSCEIINEGFDLPVATVAILLRPTQSLGLHLQQIGRVLRPVYAPGAPLETAEDRLAALKSGPKPQAIILDHVGNLHRHGLAEQPRDWSLDGYCEKRQRQLDADVLTIRNRQCPKCYAMHAPAPSCPQCGEIYESKREIETVAGELVPLGASAAVRADAWAQCPACQTVHRADLGQCPACNKDHAKDRRREIGRADTLESLIALGKSRNYKNPYAWASHLMRARGLRAKISKANEVQ